MADPEDLTLALQRAADWFDEAVRRRLAAGTGLTLTRTQWLALAALGAEPDGASVADLARRVGVRRQSMHRTVTELVDSGVLQTGPDPGDRRTSQVTLTRVGAALVRRATVEHDAVEAELIRRIGPEAVRGLRAGLAGDWGPSPTGV